MRSRQQQQKLKKDTEKKNPKRTSSPLSLILSIFLVVVGIYLFFDGYLSIIVQSEQPFEFQFFRVLRAIFGIIITIIGILIIRHNYRKRKVPLNLKKLNELKEIKKTLSSKLIYQFPLILIFSLLTFATIQYFGERWGVFPHIYLSGNFYGDEAVIFFIFSLSISFFIGYLLSHFLFLYSREKKIIQ